MKKPTLIAIAILLTGGAYFSVNAITTEDGCASGLRQIFDAERRTSGPKTDRPLVKPDTATPNHQRFVSSADRTAKAATPATPSKPSLNNAGAQTTRHTASITKIASVLALAGLAGIAVGTGLFCAGVLPVAAPWIFAGGFTAVVVGYALWAIFNPSA